MTMTNLNNALSMDELDAVVGGAKVGIGEKLLSALCEIGGDLARGVGAGGTAVTLYLKAEGLLH